MSGAPATDRAVASQPVVVHVSADFPDLVDRRKTPAIARLVDGAPGYRHVVYSLNRADGLSGIAQLPFGDDRTSVCYAAPPKGLFLSRRLSAVTDWILDDLRRKGIRPNAVHAHKFTIEGHVGYGLATAFDCPLLCNVQGNTDIQILDVRPDLRRHYARIAERAHTVFSFAPWSAEIFRRRFPAQAARCIVLPVVPSMDGFCTSPPAPPRLISIFHLDGWQNKGVERLAAAADMLAGEYDGFHVDIYGGGGSAGNLLRLRNTLARLDKKNVVRLMGVVTRDRVQSVLQSYAALVMPSIRESYGLVYVEALFSGIPIVFSKGRGVDKLFAEETAGYACDPARADDIAAGMRYVLANQAKLKQGIAAAQAAGAFDHVRRDTILAAYRSVLEAATRGAPPAS